MYENWQQSFALELIGRINENSELLKNMERAHVPVGARSTAANLGGLIRPKTELASLAQPTNLKNTLEQLRSAVARASMRRPAKIKSRLFNFNLTMPVYS
jgi:hypothetical protein